MTTAAPSTSISTEQPEQVLGLLHEQVSLYDELSRYADEQRTLITEEDTAKLLSVLEKRQRLSGRLSDMVERLEPIRKNWDHFRDRFNPAQRKEAESLLGDIRTRLRELIERDEEDVKLLSSRKQMAAVAMQSTASTHRAMAAYRSADVRPRRLDQMDEGV